MRINSVETRGGSDAIEVSSLPTLHFPRTCFRFCGVMTMWQKLLIQLLLGFFLSSLYLAAFITTAHQQRTSYLSLTQELRALSEVVSDPEEKEQMLVVAAGFDRIAVLAKEQAMLQKQCRRSTHRPARARRAQKRRAGSARPPFLGACPISRKPRQLRK